MHALTCCFQIYTTSRRRLIENRANILFLALSLMYSFSVYLCRPLSYSVYSFVSFLLLVYTVKMSSSLLFSLGKTYFIDWKVTTRVVAVDTRGKREGERRSRNWFISFFLLHFVDCTLRKAWFWSIEYLQITLIMEQGVSPSISNCLLQLDERMNAFFFFLFLRVEINFEQQATSSNWWC